jgi:hypothetical protein
MWGELCSMYLGVVFERGEDLKEAGESDNTKFAEGNDNWDLKRVF